MTPGRNDSTTTSAVARSRSNTSLPSVDFRSTVSERRLRFHTRYPSYARNGSPPGGSTLMTSAPCSASSSTPSGPAIPHERSRMRTPSSAPGMTVMGAPDVRASARPGRYLTFASACGDGQVERGEEAVAGFDDRRGAAAERVDLRRHRFDRHEVADRRHEQLRERIRGVELQRERAAVAARAGRDREGAVGPERVVVVEGAIGDRFALRGVRGARARRDDAFVDLDVLARGPAQFPLARGPRSAAGRTDANRTRSAPLGREVGSTCVTMLRPRVGWRRTSTVMVCGNGNARSFSGCAP